MATNERTKSGEIANPNSEAKDQQGRNGPPGKKTGDWDILIFFLGKERSCWARNDRRESYLKCGKKSA